MDDTRAASPLDVWSRDAGRVSGEGGSLHARRTP